MKAVTTKEAICFSVQKRDVSSPLYNTRKTSGLWLTQVCPGTGNTVRQGNYHVRHQTGAWSRRPTRTVDDGASMSVKGDGSVLPMGWAFKSAGVQRKNLTVAQKNYLTEVFQAGERTG